MCIVVDVNRLPSVLNPAVIDHYEFRPVLEWVNKRGARIIYGGGKYKTELSKMPHYFAILAEMKRGRRAQEVDEASVDSIQEEISRRTHHGNFNDQAIAAIVIVSRCRLVCSNDVQSFPFLKSRALYPGVSAPSIYTGRRNIPLLYHRHIAGKCGPCC